MNFSQEIISDANYISSYDSDAIVVREKNTTDLKQIDAHFILTASEIITDKLACHIAAITPSDIFFLIGLEPEVLIMATNANDHRLPPHTLTQFSEKSIGVEYMPLGAACRTYNLLITEGRHVVFVAWFDEREITNKTG